MKIKSTLAALLLVLNLTSLFAQDEDLNIFGYYQGYFLRMSDFNMKIPINPMLNNGTPFIEQGGVATSSFIAQQINLFLQRDFSADLGDFSAFVNLELTNNYSSAKNWGSFSLEEAWVKYSLTDAFNVKVGSLIPKFNAMNEIKNKTPLFPYMFRPVVYETVVGGLFNIEDFIPEKAFLQVYGDLAVSDDISFDYAAYVGNPESSYTGDSAFNTKGESDSFKMYGGRIGLKHDIITLGVSAVTDKDNQNRVFGNNILASENYSGIIMENVDGNLDRIKFGADISLNYGGFQFDAELISVKYDLTSEQENYINNYANTLTQGLLSTGAQMMALNGEILGDPLNPLNAIKAMQLADMNSFMGRLTSEVYESVEVAPAFDKLFYYGNLAYNFSEQFTGYANYSYVEDKSWTVLDEGLVTYSFGFSYKPTYALAIKVQHTFVEIDKIEYDMDVTMLGVSVFF